MTRSDYMILLSAIYIAPTMNETFAIFWGLLALGFGLYWCWKDGE